MNFIACELYFSKTDIEQWKNNPGTLGGQGERITWGQEFETSLANMVKPHLYKNYKN